jgi:multimeric flavodoxin WrbA
MRRLFSGVSVPACVPILAILKGEKTMVIIIHGGHRQGLCYDAAKFFEKKLVEKNANVKFYNLRDQHFDFCCGDQPCQESGKCIFNDVVVKEIIPSIVTSNALVFFTPTYFNMPPAILKNFFDRCNLLLTMEDRKHPKFAAWISGQTEESSLEDCCRNLGVFADICEFEPIESGMILRVETDPLGTKITSADEEMITELITKIID